MVIRLAVARSLLARGCTAESAPHPTPPYSRNTPQPRSAVPSSVAPATTPGECAPHSSLSNTPACTPRCTWVESPNTDGYDPAYSALPPTRSLSGDTTPAESGQSAAAISRRTCACDTSELSPHDTCIPTVHGT